MNITPIVLVVLDGWGHREEGKDNAIFEAATPFYNSLLKKFPHSLLDASEEWVGLPKGQMGNSEVGHFTMGTGRVFDVDLVRISKSIKDGSFHENPVIKEMFEFVKSHDSTLHLYGLLGPGGIHSHQKHLEALLESAKIHEIQKVAVHAITDGRDTPPRAAYEYLKELEAKLREVGIGFIATVGGRFYAMDRDKNWERIELAEKAMFEGVGKDPKGMHPSELLLKLYDEGVIDEHVEPHVFLDETGKGFKLEDNDAVMCFNFRADRARQLLSRILEKKQARNVHVVSMTEYNKAFDARIAFPTEPVDTTLAGELSKAGLTQSHIAETEKYAHVSYFFNGGREDPHEKELHILIDSRKDVKTHDQAPKMRAKEITDAALERIKAGDDFILINYANADMVGHTGNASATKTAIETLDAELRRLHEATEKAHGVMLITADHGNAETNVDENGDMHTAHTTNRVPCILTKTGIQLRDGSLKDVAPTVLTLLSLPVPREMTGTSLIIS